MTKTELRSELVRILKAESEYLIPRHPAVYRRTVEELVNPFKMSGVSKVAAIDMKGIMYGPMIASKLSVPFVPILKGNKIIDRNKALKGAEFIDYSKKRNSIEIFKGSIERNENVLLVDDWFESGNTGRSAISLIERAGVHT